MADDDAVTAARFQQEVLPLGFKLEILSGFVMGRSHRGGSALKVVRVA